VRSLRAIGLTALALILTPYVAWRRHRGKYPAIIGWWFRRVTRLLGLQIYSYGTPAKQPVLWCANHVSWLDAIALGTITDSRSISKAEVRRWPLVGFSAQAIGTLFLSRGDGAHAISEQCAEILAAGESLLIFPEGTTTDGRQVLRFYPRLFKIAIETGCPVQPIALAYFDPDGQPSRIAPFVGDDALVPHLIRVLRAGDIRLEIRFLPPIDPAGKQRRALAAKAENAIRQTLKERHSSVPAPRNPSARIHQAD